MLVSSAPKFSMAQRRMMTRGPGGQYCHGISESRRIRSISTILNPSHGCQQVRPLRPCPMPKRRRKSIDAGTPARVYPNGTDQYKKDSSLVVRRRPRRRYRLLPLCTKFPIFPFCSTVTASVLLSPVYNLRKILTR